MNYETGDILAAKWQADRFTRLRDDIINAVSEALTADDLAASKMLSRLIEMSVDRRICGDYPAPCNCDDPFLHEGH